ncbi:uncharacterized protein CXorf65 homolog [Lingula anatina]|uniref:Uncharacterized protein CXorf65 homolog n=1 Tax=Lingula anatina TaxID=7574 RepID=A0A1S3J9N6_LINAN|nr:uncharacterized protein CXorf65 homolog [Lingula anatina]|eukprot:XP_013406584.1 uncharacterized protein CXorf65 homolog [Lingula anatina]
MFITVLYGDNRQQIFNPNCLVKILLHHIKERCHLDKNDVVELSDDQGAVKNLHTNLTEYGTEFLSDREQLILLRVEKDAEGEEDRPLYIPLLDGLEEDEEFIRKLNPNPEPPSTAPKGKRLSKHRGSVVDTDGYKGKKNKQPAKKTTPRTNSAGKRGSIN